MRGALLAAGAVLLFGCAGPSRQTLVGQRGPMSLEEAQGIVAELVARQRQAAGDDPLQAPQNLEDVQEILRRDELSLFEAGADFAARQSGHEAEALHAQLELCLGEAELVLAELLGVFSSELATQARRLSIQVATGGRGAEDLESLRATRQSARDAAVASEALGRVAATHVTTGAELARGLIERHPDHYLGYRVAADYYSLREDWDAFDEMIDKLRERNPDSTGLIFLRGVAAVRRDGDRRLAAALFREALAKDPRFTRARAHLVLIQESLDDTLDELRGLELASPSHQIVLWGADRVELLHTLRRRPFVPPADAPQHPPHG